VEFEELERVTVPVAKLERPDAAGGAGQAGRAQAISDRRIALSILSRMARGLTADASWRQRVRPLKGSPMKSLLALLAIAIGVAAIVLGGIDDAPGAQLLGALLLVGVGAAWLFRRAARK
jgi:hypothetical protein